MTGDAMVGAIDDLDYHEATVTLEKSDALVMFTDGVTEAVNTTYEEFGEKRLTATLGQLVKANSQQIIDSVKTDVAAFVGEAEQSDDITLLTVKRI